MNNPQYAGFWLRFCAVLIDTVVLVFCIGIPLTLIYGKEYWLSARVYSGFWYIVINFVLPIVLTAWFWRRFLGTPGKMLLGLKVVDATTGGKLSWGQAVGRYFAYFVSMIPLCLGYLWIGIDIRKQGFHDKLAGTVVIRESVKPSEPLNDGHSSH